MSWPASARTRQAAWTAATARCSLERTPVWGAGGQGRRFPPAGHAVVLPGLRATAPYTET